MTDAELPTRTRPDEDPRLWLEEVDGERATKWADEQTARTLELIGVATLEKDEKALLEILNNPARIPRVTRQGGLLYNFWRDATHKRGLWRRTTTQSYGSASTEWEDLLNIDTLNMEEGEDWTWSGYSISPAHDRALIKLSRGGSDAKVVREFDLSTKAFVKEGFVLPEGKSSVAWLDQDTLLIGWADSDQPDSITKSGYARTIRLWRRDKALTDSPTVFEVPADHNSAGVDVDRTVSPPRMIYRDTKTWSDVTLHLGTTTGPTKVLDVPRNGHILIQGNHLVVRTRDEWHVDGQTYPKDAILAFDLHKYIEGDQKPNVLFVPGSRMGISSLTIVAGHAVILILDNLRPSIRIADLAGGFEQSIAGLPEIGEVSVQPLDEAPEERDGSLLVDIQNPITPPTVYLSSVHDTSLKVLRQAPAVFNSTGFTITKLEAAADDGELIPYILTGPDRPPNGQAYVYMVGYGGFEVKMTNDYNTRTGPSWLARGGTSVTAIIRGGGEFGASWHDAGKGKLKIVSQDDFAAIAKDIVKRGISTPHRIAAEGYSNGGLMTANMLTRHPADFGALVCGSPMTDMKRYTKLFAGAAWKSEYGDPDKAEEWEYLGKISPYHNHPESQPPPMLITTNRRDDRVHPGHARKLAAKLQDLGHDTLFYEVAGGGHTPGVDYDQAAKSFAMGFLFLRKSIGWLE